MSDPPNRTVTTPASAPGGAGAAPGEAFGRFHADQELGRGGMGQVLSAWDPTLQRHVALKILLDAQSDTREVRFLAEAQITSQLEHPNIVPVHELGFSDGGRPYFVMRRVEGRSLRQVLDAVRLGDPADLQFWTQRRLINAFVQAGQAVAFAHDRGVIHRDLKPDNIMLGAFGEVLVMDWGLARSLVSPWSDAPGRVHSLPRPGTQWGAAVGTPGYMSPEQAKGEHGRVDARSDVWSLGAILYEILTGRPPYGGASDGSILDQTLAGPPERPATRAPERPGSAGHVEVPEELAAAAMRALAVDPEDRFPTAKALLEALEAWLDGSRRRAQAAERLAEGETFWQNFLDRSADMARLGRAQDDLASSVEPWERGPRKDELVALRDTRAQVAVDAALAFARVIAMGERALSVDPGNPEARAFLARAWWHRLEEAEARGELGDVAYFGDRLREYDDGAYAGRLDGPGFLSLTTDPPGAVVIARPVVRRGLAWPLGPEVALGTTPLSRLALEPGSYVLSLSRSGRQAARYPVDIRRGQEWNGGVVPLLFPATALADFVYIPPGPCLLGGDPQAGRQRDRSEVFVGGFLLGRYPVRAGEYAAFLNALSNPEEARRRAPRRDRGLARAGAPYWRVPKEGERWEVPVTDADEDRWDPHWPVFAVSWHDAMAFAAWRSAQDGVLYDLPTEAEWEKAARGVDGRCFPWGNVFDPTAAKTEQSRPGRPQPEVVGAFPLDESPYGVRDLAGGVRDWCADPTFDGDLQRRPVRGGCWVGGERVARAANRFGFEADAVHSYIGFRLVRRLEST